MTCTSRRRVDAKRSGASRRPVVAVHTKVDDRLIAAAKHGPQLDSAFRADLWAGFVDNLIWLRPDPPPDLGRRTIRPNGSVDGDAVPARRLDMFMGHDRRVRLIESTGNVAQQRPFCSVAT